MDRASAASDGLSSSPRSYHITSITSLQPADPNAAPIVQHEETWFNGPGKMRQETHASDWSTITVTDGPQAVLVERRAQARHPGGVARLEGVIGKVSAAAGRSVTRAELTYVAPATGIRFNDMAYLHPLAPEDTRIASVLAFLGQQGCGTFRLQGSTAFDRGRRDRSRSRATPSQSGRIPTHESDR